MRMGQLKPHVLSSLEVHASAILSAWMVVLCEQQVGQQLLASRFSATPREIGAFLMLKLGVDRYKEITRLKRQAMGRRVGLGRRKDSSTKRGRSMSQEIIKEMEAVRRRREACARRLADFSDNELEGILQRLQSRLRDHRQPPRVVRPIFVTLDDY